jgi:hypothetical protein
MHRHRFSTLGALGAVVLALTLAGGTAGASSSATKKALAQGKSRLIAVSALPGHWTSSPYGSGSESGGGGGSGGGLAGAAACNTPEPGVDQNPPTVESPYFDEKKTEIEVQEEIDVYPNAKQASTDLAFSRSAAALQCFSQYFNASKGSLAKEIGSGATVGTVTDQSVPVPSYDNGTSDIRILIPVSVEGGSLTLYFDFLTMVKGQYEAIIDESNLSGPLPSKLAVSVAKAVAHKL